MAQNAIEDCSHGVEPAVDAALIGRYYGFADHAVTIGRQISYLVTGLPLER